jgi:hypothetical protein
MSPEEIESLIGSAPHAPELPEVPAGAVSPSEPIPAVDAVDPSAPRVRQYVPCTGQQISKFLAAVNGGMKDAHYASEHDIDTFLATS